MKTLDEIAAVLSAKAEALTRPSPEHLEALIHPDFLYVNARGTNFTKQSYVDVYCRSGKIKFAKQRVTDLEARLLRDTAIASYLVHDHYTTNGIEVAQTYVSTAMFTKVDDRWLWSMGQTKA